MSQRVHEPQVSTEHMREGSRLLVGQILRYIPPSHSTDEESDSQRYRAKIPDRAVFPEKPPGFPSNMTFPWYQIHLPQTAAGQRHTGPTE